MRFPDLRRGWAVRRVMLLGAALFVVACDETDPPIDPGPDGVAELAGTVTLEQRAPVEGATIRLHGGGETLEGTSDAAGEFELSEVPAGTYVVEVVPPSGYALRALDQASVTLADGERADLTIDLGAAASAGSLVVEVVHDGTGVPGILVNVMQVGPNPLDSLALDTLASAPTDANGRAIFALDAATYVVEIRTGGSPWSVNGIRRFGVIVLEGTVTWEGFELYTGSHEPPTHDEVEVFGYARLNEADGVAGVRVTMSRMDVELEATTDASGRFAIPSIAPGAWQVDVDLPAGYTLAHGQQGSFVHVLSEHDTIARFDVALANQDGDGLLTTLVWGDSVFIEDATLTVYQQGTSNVVATGSTDASGRWHPLVPPGTYTVVLDVPDGWKMMNGGSPTLSNIVVNAGRRTWASFYLTAE